VIVLLSLILLAAIILTPAIRGVFRGHESSKDPDILVQTAVARVGRMDSFIEVSGDIKALHSVSLSPQIPGHVVAVPYREGDAVRAGDVVVRQDTADMMAQVRQAEAGLAVAKSRLSQAMTAARLSDTQVEAGIAQARAAVEGANARVHMVKAGARTQEIAQAQTQVDSAKANFKNAEITLERMRGLYSDGALAKQQMDLIQLQYDVASSQYEAAKQQLSLVKAGARAEEIEGAQTQADEAKQGLKIARSNRANTALREEDIKSAKAGVAQAEAALALAKQMCADAYIRSPIAGTVARRYTEPGQMANPGMPVMDIVALDSLYFEAVLSEIDVSKVKTGQPVEITVDALPGRTFDGVLTKILPTADPRSRQFTVRMEVSSKTARLRPGMFARGKIRIARHDNTVIIPKDALITSGKNAAVYIIKNSTATLKPITAGFETREEVEALSGVQAGDELVKSGQDKLSDGVKVHVAN